MGMIYRTEYMHQLHAFKDNKLIKVVTGLRRCGKSTLLQMFADELIASGVSQQRIVTINFELMRYDDIRTYRVLYDFITPLLCSQARTYLFLDEIQQVSGWEKAINSLSIEYDIDIYITGSNAHLLSSELSTLISGRYVELKMLPLSFKEFYDYFATSGQTREFLFHTYLRHGGLPQLLTLPPDEKTIDVFLKSIYDTIILKDVVQRNNIKDFDMLQRIFKFICGNVGSIVSSNKISTYISKEAKLDRDVRAATVSNYLKMLESAFIIYRAERYDVKGKEVLKSLEKYYVADIGLRNALLGYDLADYGHLLENCVYLELVRRNHSVYVGKHNDKEIDFVTIDSNGRKYYQVTQSLVDEKTQERELAPFASIGDHYEKIIITADTNLIKDANGIRIINIIDFLLGDE